MYTNQLCLRNGKILPRKSLSIKTPVNKGKVPPRKVTGGTADPKKVTLAKARGRPPKRDIAA